MRSNSLRLLIYSQDGLGLGHQCRTRRIAEHLLRLAPGTSVLTVCDSPLGGFFPPLRGQRYLELPTLIKRDEGRWSTLHAEGDLRRVCDLRGELIGRALEEFRPDVILVDHMPHGACGELLPWLEESRRRGCRRIILGLRDILDEPQTIRNRWQREGAYEALRDLYDQILVYGEQDVFDTARLYEIPSGTPLEYCGYVAPPKTNERVYRLRQKYLAGSRPGTKLLLATAGGGADGGELMSSLLDCLSAVEARVPVMLVMVLGPHFPDQDAARVRRKAAGRPVQVLRSTRHVVLHMRAADAAVAMAGYNTTMELLRSRTPALVVPRRGPSAEQRMRASCFSERGWLRVIQPWQLGSGALGAGVVGILRESAADGIHSPSLDGAENAAMHVLRNLDGSCEKNRWSIT
jgi:predicted glycosyltransferase